jgi:hypothetical protein
LVFLDNPVTSTVKPSLTRVIISVVRRIISQPGAEFSPDLGYLALVLDSIVGAAPYLDAALPICPGSFVSRQAKCAAMWVLLLVR